MIIHSELIKNKTLHFLAKALPYLKEDMDSIPKVVKLSKVPDAPKVDPLIHPSQSSHGHISPPNHHAQSHPHHVMANGGMSLQTPAAYYDYQHVKKRSVRETEKQMRGLLGGFSGNNWNLTEARQKACEQKDGMLV